MINDLNILRGHFLTEQKKMLKNTVVGGYSDTLGDQQKCHCNRLSLQQQLKNDPYLSKIHQIRLILSYVSQSINL